MTAAEVKKRVDVIKTGDRCGHFQDARAAERFLLIDVLRAIATSGINRSTTRALAEEALRLFE